MKHRLVWAHSLVFSWRHMWSEEIVAILLVLFVFATPAMAAMRLQERGLYMQSSRPGEATAYEVSFRYMSLQPVGSVDLLFCVDPIPYNPCVTPPGFDASNAVLSNQSGEVGYSILSKTTNHIVLTRPSSMVAGNKATYRLEGIVNPTDTELSFSLRIRTHSTYNATGAQIDFGSVKGEVTEGVVIETQVPPMLIFCAAQVVEENCTDTNETRYSDLGQLDPKSTLLTQSQMAVGTNASGGFAIVANGTLMSAGANVIDSPAVPTASLQGINQFGLNLVANTDPAIGGDPEGAWANALPSPDYGVPNKYKFVPGDVVAYSPNVSLMKKFTVSYILNSNENLKAGVYTTTITYVASGRF